MVARFVSLPSAGVPADHGMASLGLMMQLAGRTSAALAALVVSVIVLESQMPRNGGWFLLAVALCIARSLLHRAAGRDLLYGRRTLDGEVADPLEAMRTYVAFGIAHSIAMGLISAHALGATTRTAAGISAALALWPIVLALVLRLPRFRALRGGIPLGEDRGLEAASILMTILGAAGVLSTGAIILVLAGLPSRHLEHGWGTMLVVVFLLLLVRSSLHMRSGLAGLHERSFDRPGELANRYVSFGVISAFCVGGVLALLAMSARLAPEAITSVVVMSWLLAIWPMILRRYVSHRQFAELLAGDRVLHRRAPDAGLTGLGWLLAGHASIVAALLILELTIEHRGVGWVLASLLQLAGPVGSRTSAGVGLAILGLEALAAIALIRMSDHRRAIATTYAVVASGAALSAAWPIAGAFGQSHDLRTILPWIPAAIQIAIPAATLVLVRRALVPFARARFRQT